MEARPNTDQASATEWTFPTRICRICFESVVPTITMYPPGLPASFQRPVVEYKSDEEYGRLVKPCLCRGSQRYIHEHCLRQQRTLGARPNSLWKCPTCGYTFSFQKLRTQRLLTSRGSAVGFTLLFLLVMIFVLGFVADPIINLYIDPYETLATNDYWHPVEVNKVEADAVSAWGAHFLKGFVSMGVVGFVKTLAMNPWNWFHWRTTGIMGGRARTPHTGQDRAANISWIAIVIGICSAFYLLYEWVKSIIAAFLARIGNHIVDTQLPGDDDDIKPPATWKPAVAKEETVDGSTSSAHPEASSRAEEMRSTMPGVFEDSPSSEAHTPVATTGRTVGASKDDEWESVGLGAAQRQGWSFNGL